MTSVHVHAPAVVTPVVANAGDTLLFTVSQTVTLSTIEDMKAKLQHHFPRNEIVVCCCSSVTVVKGEDRVC